MRRVGRSRRVLLLPVCALAITQLGATPAAAATQSFANPAPIKIPASGNSGPATPYPSSIVVSGMVGPITDVNVTLHRVSHTYPADISVLLVPPSGRPVSLMRGNCGSKKIEIFTWILDQQAANPMPTGGSSSCPDFVYRPNTLLGAATAMPAPAPGLPYSASLDSLDGRNPNGSWSLYVSDVNFGSCCSGTVAGGWTLTITTGPVDIAIPGTGTSGGASPYPAVVTVEPGNTVITDLDVRVDGVWHQRPDDLDVLLVGPHGEKALLMSDACGTSEVVNASWRWDDEGVAPMADGGSDACGSGAWRPADYEPGEGLPLPAPSGPYKAALTAFDLTDPGGDWRVFVNDDSSGAVGFVTTGIRFTYTARPKAPVAFTESTVSVAEGASRSLTLTRSGPARLGAGSVTIATVPASAGSGSDFTPLSTVIEFAAGQTERRVQVNALADGVDEQDEVYAVTISSATGDAAVTGPSSVAVTIAVPDPPPAGTPPTPPARPASIARLGVSPLAFRAASSGPSARAAGASPTGAIVSFIGDKAAVVTYRVARALSGRRARERCVAPDRASRTAPSCTRLVTVSGGFSRSAAAGLNRFRFTGRIGGRKLQAGRYQLRATPRSGGHAGATRRTGFRIVH